MFCKTTSLQGGTSTGLHSICITAEQGSPCASVPANNSTVVSKYGANFLRCRNFVCTKQRLDLPTVRTISALKAQHQVHALPRSLRHSSAKRKMQRAGWIAGLYSGITQPFSIQNSPKLLEMSAMLFNELSENCCSPKLPAFKVGRRLGCIQSASPQNNRYMSCNRESCVPLFSQIIPRFVPNMDQM